MTPQTSDVAFPERRSDRLVIRRFRAEDAASLAAYRSDPATARYQSWDVPFSHAHARSFIEGLEGTNPDSPGQWFQFAMVEAATGAHIGDVAAGVDADDPRLATIGVTLATSAQGQGYAGEAHHLQSAWWKGSGSTSTSTPSSPESRKSRAPQPLRSWPARTGVR